SVVASMLRELQFHVLDADRLAHQLSEPGQPAYREIVQEFGAEILGSDDHIDRNRLASIVFPDRARLDRLNTILHPRVQEATFAQFAAWQRAGTNDPVFVEAALLVEAGFHHSLDGLIVAWCKPEQQLERLIDRGLTEAEARNRIASQMPVED